MADEEPDGQLDEEDARREQPESDADVARQLWSQSQSEQAGEAGEASEPGLSAEMVTRAKSQYGLSEEYIQAHSDDESLLETLSQMDRYLAGLLEQARLQDQQFPQQQFPQQQFPQQQWPQSVGGLPQQLGRGLPLSPAPTAPAAGPPAPSEFKLPISDEWDESLVKALQGLHTHHAGQVQSVGEKVAALESQLAQVLGVVDAFQHQQNAQVSAWFDEKISQLGDDWSPVFGKGSRGGMPQGSKEAVARDRLFEQFLANMQLLPSAGYDELFERARQIAFWEHSRELDKKRLAQSLRKRAAKTIGRPTRRTGALSREAMNDQFGLPQSDVNELLEAHRRMTSGEA